MSIMKWGQIDDVVERLIHQVLDVPLQKLSLDLAADVYEDGDNVVAEMTVPDVDPEQIGVSVQGNALRIFGSREEKHEKQEKNYFSKEIRRGDFERVLMLPAEVVADRVTANYENGVLTVTMPKKVKEQGKRIKVNVTK